MFAWSIDIVYDIVFSSLEYRATFLFIPDQFWGNLIEDSSTYFSSFFMSFNVLKVILVLTFQLDYFTA